MTLARSKLTSQGQISVPAEVRNRLGIGPGAELEWNLQAGHVVVKRASRYTSEDIHRALFPEGPPKRRTLAELKKARGSYAEDRNARRGH